MNNVRERVEKAIATMRRGELVVVADATNRENEGDLIGRADTMTRERMAYLLRHTSGLVCVAMTAERTLELELPLMVAENTESHATAFTVSVDVKQGTTTGISAADRALTVRALASASARPAHFARPGHVFPLRARAGGVLTRPGHTEATVDLARLAGAPPVGVLCELMGRDGEMLRGGDLRRFAAREGLAFITVEELIDYRRLRDIGPRRAPLRDNQLRTAREGNEAVASETREQQQLRAVAQA